MRHGNIIRYFRLIFAVLATATALLTSSAWTQQPTVERPVWDVQMARNAQAKSTITIQNQCQQTHAFTVTEQQTPFLQLLTAPTVSVPGKSNYEVPVRFDTNGMNAGEYRGTVLVKCDTCRKEKTCKQDREVLPLHLVVRGEDGPQMTPENPTQPQVPGPPILKQDAAKPKASPSKDEAPKGTALDEEDKKTDTEFTKDVDKDKLKKCKGTCKTREKYTVGDGTTWAYCPASTSCKAPCDCHLFTALKQGEKNPDPNDKDGEAFKLRPAGTSPGSEKTKQRPQAQTDKKRIVACVCYQL